MIERFFTDTFTVKEQEWTTDASGNEGSDLVAKTTFSGHIQQAGVEMIERYNMNFQTAYVIWCPVDTDVDISDMIEDGVYRYSIRGIKVNNTGNNTHLELAVDGGVTIES